MSRIVTLIRHAETEANAASRWQGSINAPFTDRGEDQIARLTKRFADRRPQRLVTSDLERTMATAQALGDPEADARWREFHVGAWEGLTSDEVRQRFPGELERLFRGEDIELGGGDRMSAFRARVTDAFDVLVDSLDEDEEAVVVTHGGVIWAIVRDVLGLGARSTSVTLSPNTAVTRIGVSSDGDRQLSVFNDASHLDEVPTRYGPMGKVVSLFRHGQTEGNVAGKWQGRSDSPLTDLGRWQIQTATNHAPPIETLFTSPLGRTLDTATVLGSHLAIEPIQHPDLVEMSFGSWENLTVDEAAQADPALFETIYVHGDDQPRGGDGESFTEAGLRMQAALAVLAADLPHRSIGVVSHGAIIRAFVAQVTGLGFVDRNRIPVPRNSSITSVVYGEAGVALSSYNVAPHLD